MNKRVDAALTVVLTVCAVVVTVTYVARQFGDPPTAPVQKPAYVASWNELITGSVLRVGSAEAPVQIIEFGDFQCPFCREFHVSFDSLFAEFPSDVSLVFYHYPLPYHKHAEPAARAAECAAEQNRFAEIAREMFANQDSLGIRPWDAVARSALVDNPDRFTQCMGDARVGQRIKAAADRGRSLQVKGTPTVIINGWRYPFAPPLDSLRQIVERIRAKVSIQ